MRTLSYTLAWHYLWSSRKDAAIRFMIRVCFLGIMIGSAALMLTLIITNGFEQVICEKLMGINAHVTISLAGHKLHYHEIRDLLLAEYPDRIRGVSGSSLKQAIIERGDQQTVLVLKGIDPEHEHTVSVLHRKITNPKPRAGDDEQVLSRLTDSATIIIGYKCAHDLGLGVGDRLSLLIPEASNARRIILNKKKVTVVGIFDIGLDEYDANVAFMSLDYLNELFDEQGVDQIRLSMFDEPRYAGDGMLAQFFHHLLYKIGYRDAERELLDRVHTRLPHLSVYSWKDLSPALVSSLKLEKYVMFFIIVLITLVACMNMIALLFMLIQQKRRDIALFKTIGMSKEMIRNIFLWLGMILTGSATAVGLCVAGVLGYFLEFHAMIPLPDVYYVSHLPARMELYLFLIVFIVSCCLGFIATWVPAIRAQRMIVADVVRL